MPGAFPVPMGVLRGVDEPVYDDLVVKEAEDLVSKRGAGDFDKLFASGDTWVVN